MRSCLSLLMPEFSFNGAASERGGEPLFAWTSPRQAASFNGAASERGGERLLARACRAPAKDASTEPPLNEAENP